jgi:hypothetical protein
MRTNSEIFLRALASGFPVELKGRTFRLIKAGDDIIAPSGVYHADWDVLVTLATARSGDGPERQVMMPCDVEFNILMSMCTAMTEEERFNIVASQVLAQENSRKR